MKNITMKNGLVKRFAVMLAMAMLLALSVGMTAFAKEKTSDKSKVTQVVANETQTADIAESEDAADSTTGNKAMAAAIVVGLAAAAGAIGMGIAIAKSSEGISRQPEAEGKIRTTLMLGLVFIETAIIYALIVAILIIFVM